MKNSLGQQAQLRDEIATSFNEEELQSLCFDLDIIYQDLAGTTRLTKIIDIIQFCDRHKQTEQLIQRCQTLRPNGNWSFLEDATPTSLSNSPTLDYQQHILAVEKSLNLVIEKCQNENRNIQLGEIFPILRKLFNRHTYSEPFALCKDENWHDRFIAAGQTVYFLGEYWFKIQSAATREKDIKKLETFEKVQDLLRIYAQEMTALFRPRPWVADVNNALENGSTIELRNHLAQNRCLRNTAVEKPLAQDLENTFAKCEAVRIEIELEVNQWPKI
jgi:hypothetical protein